MNSFLFYLIYLCFYGITVFSATVRLAEKIANRRQFIMKYDFEIPVHDIIGRQEKSINKMYLLKYPGVLEIAGTWKQYSGRNVSEFC